MAARTRMGLLAVALFFLAVSLVTAEEPNQKLQITRSARVVDLSTQLVNQTADITILNEGDSAAKHFLYSVEDSLAPKLAYISAKVYTSLLLIPTSLLLIPTCLFLLGQRKEEFATSYREQSEAPGTGYYSLSYHLPAGSTSLGVHHHHSDDYILTLYSTTSQRDHSIRETACSVCWQHLPVHLVSLQDTEH